MWKHHLDERELDLPWVSRREEEDNSKNVTAEATDQGRGLINEPRGSGVACPISTGDWGLSPCLPGAHCLVKASVAPNDF